MHANRLVPKTTFAPKHVCVCQGVEEGRKGSSVVLNEDSVIHRLRVYTGQLYVY